ncbi:hypothetical protein [Streptomyces sp. NPDC048438]|uniref:hypothetical protein n=1 Tax=Streptomyces sp. NPDC048438 TaxID=3365551 RepID=UPI00371A3880
MHEEAVETRRLIAQEAARPSPPDRWTLPTRTPSAPGWRRPPTRSAGSAIVYADAAAVRFGAIDSQPYDDFAFTMRVELDSVWLTAHLAWPHLYAAAAASSPSARRPG